MKPDTWPGDLALRPDCTLIEIVTITSGMLKEDAFNLSTVVVVDHSLLTLKRKDGSDRLTESQFERNFGLCLRPVTKGARKKMSLGIPELLVLVVLVFGIGGTIFWIWVLIDCATKEPSDGNDKVVWIIIIVLTHWVGAMLYLLIRRPQRTARYGR